MEDIKQAAGQSVPISRYLLALVMATALFVAVFLAVYSISYLNYEETVAEQNIIRTYISDFDSLLILQKSCDVSVLVQASEKLDRVGWRLSLLETRFGKNDARVLEQKSSYNELEVRHLELVKLFQQQCKIPFVPILFFYSNKEEHKDESERVGFVLSTLKRKSPEKVMIYSFDYNLKSELIRELKEKYRVKEAPIVLVNESYFAKVSNIDELLPYIS
ncbi:MAG: hypothetical protein AABW65_01500 [Nanoarchaeota archaeon]